LDGSGYPKGLKNNQIIKEARILAVADVAEAMLARRPYRPPIPIEEVLKYLEENKGKTLRPRSGRGMQEGIFLRDDSTKSAAQSRHRR
jgi:HD-GYP domain-containing protein (c-di-GMP phosphodiesterase class II)